MLSWQIAQSCCPLMFGGNLSFHNFLSASVSFRKRNQSEFKEAEDAEKRCLSAISAIKRNLAIVAREFLTMNYPALVFIGDPIRSFVGL